MKHVPLEATWPPSWQYSYPYDLQEVYDEPTVRGYAYAYAERRKRTLRLLADALEPPARILDLAAAQGNFSLALAEMGYRVTWNDLREDLAGYVQLKYERGDIEYAPGDAFQLRFDEPFDAVLATEIIEHVAHPDEFLASAARLVRPGGYIVLTTPNGAYFRNNLPKFSECADPSAFESRQFGPNSQDHIFLLHPEEIPDLAGRAGLDVDQLELFTNPLTAGHVKLEALLKALPRKAVEAVESGTSALPYVVRKRILTHIGARLKLPG